MVEYRLNCDLLSLKVSDLLIEMGYGSQKPEEEITLLTSSMLEDISQWVTPYCSFCIKSGQIEGDVVWLDDHEQLSVGPVIASLLKGAVRFALFAATVGMEFQKYQEELKKEGDMLKVFIADVIGTCLVEKAGDYMERLLEEERHTNRFSPGYCNWHLTGQKQLFKLMGDTPCGINLSEVCLMTPIKSISGIIGIGQEVDEKKYGCQYCELETCYKRKKRN